MDLKVHINNIHGSQMAAKITGKFTLENIEFKQNKIVDNMGVILEKSYDDARTK